MGCFSPTVLACRMQADQGLFACAGNQSKPTTVCFGREEETTVSSWCMSRVDQQILFRTLWVSRQFLCPPISPTWACWKQNTFQVMSPQALPLGTTATHRATSHFINLDQAL